MKKLLNFILNFIWKKHKERVTDIVSCDFSAPNFFEKINHFSSYFFRVYCLVLSDIFNLYKIAQSFYRINRDFIIFKCPNFSQLINYNNGFKIKGRKNFFGLFYTFNFGFKLIAIMTFPIFIEMPIFIIDGIFSIGVSQSQPFCNRTRSKKIFVSRRKIFIYLMFLRLENSVFLKKFYQQFRVFDINLNFNFNIFVGHRLKNFLPPKLKYNF